MINFIPGERNRSPRGVLADRNLAGIHFTGSTAVFQSLWKGVAAGLEGYASYPRIVGETGGKDFIVAHPSADAEALAVAMVRGAFEYQGQKCSAASRAYIPQSLWPAVKQRALEMIADITMGDVSDFRNFMGAVIDARSFAKLKGYLDQARKDRGVTILAGGGADDKKGWFIEPTLLLVKDRQLPHDVRRAFRAGADHLRLSRQELEGDPRTGERTSPYARPAQSSRRIAGR